MNEENITPQQQREHSDPHEKRNPVPWYVVIIVALMCAFGVSYIATTPLDTPSEWGDGRHEGDLAASAGGASAGAVNGAAIYAARCVACHQADGNGLPNVFPPLAGSEWVTGDPNILAAILLHGSTGAMTVKGITYHGSMPSFRVQLSDAEIAAVASHIRTQWGNAAAAIDDSAVRKVRDATADRSGPYKGGLELQAMK